MSSAGHCGRHDTYRCSYCYEYHNDDYHSTDAEGLTEALTRIVKAKRDMMATVVPIEIANARTELYRAIDAAREKLL